MKQKALEEELRLCFIDWDGDFDIDIEQESAHGGWAYFAVLVTHKFLAGISNSSHASMIAAIAKWITAMTAGKTSTKATCLRVDVV